MFDLSILDTDDLSREIGHARLREMALAKQLATVLEAQAPQPEPPIRLQRRRRKAEPEMSEGPPAA